MVFQIFSVFLSVIVFRSEIILVFMLCMAKSLVKECHNVKNCLLIGFVINRYSEYSRMLIFYFYFFIVAL